MAKTWTRGERPAPYELIKALQEQVHGKPAEEAVFALSWVIVDIVKHISPAPRKIETATNVVEQLKAMLVFRA